MENLLTIGEVSKMFKTTTRQLRFYEEINLLQPVKVDENNGYRYYSNENCNQLKKILCLKDMGLSLSDISNYFSSKINEKKKILLKYLNIGKQMQYTINQITKENDYDLNFVEDINYVGNDVRKKNLSTLCGVWILDGIYKDIKDARADKNPIEKVTPYKFLAFDEFGNSPWFYFADDQFITFDTWSKPSKEIYQVHNDKIYLKINNPNEHIFGQIEDPIVEKHVLVFKKAGDNYDDYQKLLFHDTFEKKFVIDEKLIGVWNLNNKYKQKYLIVNEDGTANICFKEGIKPLKWSKGCFYDEKFNVKLNYLIKNNKLIVENKSKIYVFSGISGEIEEYIKLK